MQLYYILHYLSFYPLTAIFIVHCQNVRRLEQDGYTRRLDETTRLDETCFRAGAMDPARAAHYTG